MARNVVATLPVPRTSLLGREPERAEILRLIVDERVPLLTLTGPGGVGKTRLALAVAAALETDADEDVLFVPLAPVREAALVLPAIAASLGLRESPVRSAAGSLVETLRGLQLILVLDNLEHVAAAGPDLAWVLETCPRVQIVATSRSRLHIGAEHMFPVPPLPIPDLEANLQGVTALDNPAVDLFCQRARQANPRFALTADTSATVATIVARLDGLPLAIELAAARAAMVTPETLLARLDRRLRLLTGGPDDAPSRLRSLADAIAWSYDLLTPGQAALFRRLSVFVGGFDAHAAIAVAGGDPVAVLDDVHGLIDQSLVSVDRAMPADGTGAPGRLLILETIREFGLERLAEWGEAGDASARHAAWALELAEAAEAHIIGPSERAWCNRLDAELANLRAALGWSLEHEPVTALRLMGALRTYWCRRAPISEGRRWLEAALAAAPDAPAQVRARGYCALSHLATLQGAMATVRESATRAVSLSDAGGDDRTKAWSLSQLFMADLVAGNLETAVPHLTQAIALLDHATRDSDRGWQAYILQGQGYVAKLLGDHAQAHAVYSDALRRARAVGTDAVVHSVLEEFAALLVEAGETERARGFALEALEIAARSMESWLLGFVLLTMGYIEVLTGDASRAAELCGASDAVLQESGAVFLMPLHRQREAVVVERAQAVLGPDRYAAYRAQGRAAPLTVIADAIRQAPAGNQPLVAASSLTQREGDVLRLLTTGMTDREIGSALFISRKTASNHVASILRKLKVESRAAAAIYAVRAGLA